MPQTQPRDKAEWMLLTLSMEALHSVLTTKPAVFRTRHAIEPEGILNAYRQGDLCFDDAVAELLQWRGRA